MRMQSHHIEYRPKEWTVVIGAYMHKCITIIQRTKANEEFYAILTGFVHAIVHEWNRVRKDLDKE